MTPTDAELLTRYLQNRDEAAFTEIVRRHLGVVYAAALRRTGRAHLADDIAQAVFAQLARNARWLSGHPMLVAWLYRCTRNAAIDALRAEARRARLAQTAAAMTDDLSSPPPDVDWARLRPVLDDAIDGLKDRDREIVLLRFFQGLTFGEVGERMGISENTARMRSVRALERLREQLGRRGVGSTTAALGLLLANPALASAPAGLASAIAGASLAAVPAGVSSGLVSFFFMGKLTTPLIGAALGAALVTTLWYNTARGQQAAERERLQAENLRLTQVLKADELSDRAASAAQAIHTLQTTRARLSDQTRETAARAGTNPASNATRRAASPRGHRWAGQATPEDAGRSFAWASDVTDIDAIATLIWFEPEVRERARAMLATMPASIRADYPTPEAFYAFVIATDALFYPPPVPETAPRFKQVTLREGRVAFRRDGSNYNMQEYQQTPEGWKYVVPLVGVERWPANLDNQLLFKLSQHP